MPSLLIQCALQIQYTVSLFSPVPPPISRVLVAEYPSLSYTSLFLSLSLSLSLSLCLAVSVLRYWRVCSECSPLCLCPAPLPARLAGKPGAWSFKARAGARTVLYRGMMSGAHCGQVCHQGSDTELG